MEIPTTHSNPTMSGVQFPVNVQTIDHPSLEAEDNTLGGTWGQVPSGEVTGLEQGRQGEDLELNPSQKLFSTHRHTYY